MLSKARLSYKVEQSTFAGRKPFRVDDKRKINRTANMNAVEVRGGYKFYGKDKDPKIILNRLDMNVSHGSM